MLFSLFWAVQGSLLSWCHLQLRSTDSAAREVAADLLDQCECWYLTSQGHGKREVLGFDCRLECLMHGDRIWCSLLEYRLYLSLGGCFLLQIEFCSMSFCSEFSAEGGSMLKWGF